MMPVAISPVVELCVAGTAVVMSPITIVELLVEADIVLPVGSAIVFVVKRTLLPGYMPHRQHE